MFKPDSKLLPKNPGIYIFKDKNNSIIYIGKAKNLKNRINQYFSSKHENSPKTQFLVKNITDFEFIIVDNEIEALLLENKLIKKHKPKYNINLKDSKTYPYIKITNEEIPKIIMTRIVKDDGTYFGPYTDGIARKEIFYLTIKLFKLITKSTYSSKSKLNYDIGLAPASNLNQINKTQYLKQVQDAKEFLKGNTKKIEQKLISEMKTLSNEKKYELANEKKKQIEAIEHLNEKQKVDLIKGFDQDILVIVSDLAKEKILIQVLNISKGVILGKKDFKFNRIDQDLFEEFFKMYYSSNSIPKEIIVNIKFWKNEDDKKLLEDYLFKLKKSKTTIIFPQKGEKLALLNLAQKNAKISIKTKDILEQLKDILSLPKLPIIIECFDISNLGFEHNVGAMTRWVDKIPDKNNYRKFEIKSFQGKNDDYAAIKEVVYRRYKRLKNEQMPMPDLIIIDGGKGQLKSAIESLKELNLKLPIISIAKKEEEIFLPGKSQSIKLDKNSESMLYLRKIRDSVHDFVLSYNKKKRQLKLKKEFEN